jgi:hypothetical protein
MLNNRWLRRILNATKTDVMTSEPSGDWAIIDGENEMLNKVQDNSKLMEYLQKDNISGHATNLDMLLSSLNLHQHLREAFLSASCTIDAENNLYVITFPFGTKTIEYKLSTKAIDAIND